MTLYSILLSILLLGLSACLPQSNDPALSENHSDTGVVTTQGVSYTVRISDRYFLSSVMETVFLSPSATEPSDSTVRDLIKENIYSNGAGFAGPCSDYDDQSCRELSGIDYQTLSWLPATGAPGDAAIVTTCAEILDVTGVMEIVDVKISRSPSSTPNERAQVDSLYSLFHPGKSISSAAYDGLKNLYDKTVLAGGDSNSGWKAIYYTMCISPSWRIP